MVVAFGVAFVVVVHFSRVRCSFVCRWLGCLSHGGRGRGSCWLFESVAYEVAFHSIPFRVVIRRGEPGHVAREVVVVLCWLCQAVRNC